MAELGFISRIEISDFFSRVPCFHYPKKVSVEIGMTFKRYLGNGTDRNGEGTILFLYGEEESKIPHLYGSFLYGEEESKVLCF